MTMPMLLFWSLAGVMVFAAVLVLTRALSRGAALMTGGATAGADAPARIALYRARLAELTAEAADGGLSPEQARLTRAEIEAALLSEIERQGEPAPRQEAAANASARQRGGRCAAVLALLIPPLTVAGYLYLGEPRLADPRYLATRPPPEQPELSIEEILRELQARLRQRPDDTRAWLALTRAYLTLGETDKAVAAARELHRLGGDQPRVLAQYIEALALAADGELAGEPRRLIERLLELDPAHKAGLWFAGLAAEQAGEWRRALEHWRRLLPLLEDEPAPQERVRALVARVEARLEEDAAAEE